MTDFPLFEVSAKQISTEMAELLKNKREKFRTQIRKSKLSDELNRKRFILPVEIKSNLPIEEKDHELFYENIQRRMAAKEQDLIKIQMELKELIFKDMEESLKYVKKFKIFEYLKRYISVEFDEERELQYQTIWNFSNLFAFEKEIEFITDFLMKNQDIIHNLIRHLTSHHLDSEFISLVFLCLGNISGKSEETKNLLLKSNIVTHTLNVFEKIERPISTLSESIWLISTLTRKTQDFYEDLRRFLPLLRNALLFENPCLYEDILWSLAYLSDGEDDQVKDILSLGITSKIISFATNCRKELKIPAVRTLCNFLTTSDDSDAKLAIENGLLDCFSILIDDDNEVIRKEVCWGISNLMICDGDVIEDICSHELINKIFIHSNIDTKYRVKNIKYLFIKICE